MHREVSLSGAHGWAEILELYTGTREEYDPKQLQNTL